MDLRELARVGQEIEARRHACPPQLVQVPVQFSFAIAPARWELTTKKGGVRLIQRPAPTPLRRPTDARRMRKEFLGLKKDSTALLKFLNTYGRWADYVPAKPEDYWEFQEDLRGWMLWPAETLRRILGRFGLWERPFEARFVWADDAPRFDVAVSGCEDALIASIQIDLVRGVRFQMCARPDCGVVFPLESQHERKYCDEPCKRRVMMRNLRKRKKANASTGGKNVNI